jgi:hypothetical protein
MRRSFFSALFWVLLSLKVLPEVASKQQKRISRRKRLTKLTVTDDKRSTKIIKKDNQVSPNSKRTIGNASAPISVQAILIPRAVKIQTAIRLLCLGLTLLSLVECFQTAGYPHIQTIWSLVNADKRPMPSAYRPSILDIQLARLLANASKEIIPPISLPSTKALLGIVTSSMGFIATILLPRWSTNIKVASDFRKLESGSFIELKDNTHLLLRIDDPSLKQEMGSIRQEGDRVSSQICALKEVPKRSSKRKKIKIPDICRTLGLEDDHPRPHFFEFNQGRFYFDTDSMSCSDGGPILHKAPIRDLKALLENGLSKHQRLVATERYRPYNEPKLASPTIQDAFYARISSPLVVVQLLGRLLSCLEEGFRSLINTVITLSQHFMNARQAIISAKQMAQEVQTSVKDTSFLQVMLYDTIKKKWKRTTASDLLPGDIFLLKASAQNLEDVVIPVDALLLDGQCLTNEAVLTGESVPQSKIPMGFEEELTREDGDAHLDMQDHRSSILFAGTTLIHTTKSSGTLFGETGNLSLPHPKESGTICLALRTGTYSSKGRLLRALKSNAHVGAISNSESEKDSIRLIASLSVFALMSCISLFASQGEHGNSVPAYRRVIQCTRVACASIPSDLPLSLSTIAKSCSQKLREESDVVCSEPGSLLTAAYIDTVVFDKTGTLTAYVYCFLTAFLSLSV